MATPFVKFFRLDFYKNQHYDNATLLEAFNSAIYQLSKEEVSFTQIDPSLAVEFQSDDRHWARWNQEVDNNVSQQIRESPEKTAIVVTGKSPLSMFLKLGLVLSRPLFIANELGNTGKWQLFDLSKEGDVSLLQSKRLDTTTTDPSQAAGKKKWSFYLSL